VGLVHFARSYLPYFNNGLSGSVHANTTELLQIKEDKVERQNENSKSSGRSNITGSSSQDISLAVRASSKNYYLKFPKEFERSLGDYFDRRYVLILLCTCIVHVASILIFLANPPKEEFTQEDIQRIQRQFASLVLETEPVKLEEPEQDLVGDLAQGGEAAEAEEGSGGGGEKEEDKGSQQDKKKSSSSETKTASAEERSASRRSAAASRRRSREQISREVASKGILGVLTAGGSAASGQGVVDVLGEGSSVNDNIGAVLGEIGGLKTTGAPVQGSASGGKGGKGVRGSRSSSSGSIDDLIGDLGSASTKDVSRRGSIVVAEEAAIEEGPGGAKSSGRDREQIMAVVHSHSSAIQACYQRGLKRDPDLRGKIVVRFTINYLGKVTKVNVVNSTLNNPSVERCVVSRIRRWDDFGVIDKSKGDATIRQVYTFGY
jgi:TonB family protein